MSNVIKAGASGGGDFAPIPAGTHIARAIRVIDLGTQMVQKYKATPGELEPKEKLMIIFELPYETMIDKEGKEMPMVKSKEYTKSLHEKAVLRKDLQSWRGKAFTDEELAGFNVNNIVGKPCQVSIEHEVKGDKTYTNITAVVGMAKGSTCPEAVNPVFTYEIEEGESGHFSEMPEWIQEKIKKSLEFTVPQTQPYGINSVPEGEPPSPMEAEYDNLDSSELPF